MKDISKDEGRLIFTVDEARQKLGISRGLIYEAVRRGEIPHIHVGKRLLIPQTALTKLLESANCDAANIKTK